jgi:3'(2'), 5'-bisphosphate nucleotidase
MIDQSAPEVAFAVDAVRRAALLVKQVQAEMVSSSLTKEDRSPVTVADFASQALVSQMLAGAFPRDILVAEEDAGVLRQDAGKSTLDRVTHFVSRFAGEAKPGEICDWIDRGRAEPASRFWTLDPIDGTKGFLRGDQYAVALALIEEGEVQVGVLGCPNLARGLGGAGSLFVAAPGAGAWWAILDEQDPVENALFRQLHVSDQHDPAAARLLRSFESGHTNVDQIDEFAIALSVQAAPVRMDSQAKYGVLAAGEGELYLRLLSRRQPDYHEKIWDQAAGALLVEEAGGRVTDLHGRPLDFNAGRTLAKNRGVLASNKVLHEAALQALQVIAV